jgi:hypothetical protein
MMQRTSKNIQNAKILLIGMSLGFMDIELKEIVCIIRISPLFIVFGYLVGGLELEKVETWL